MGEASPTDITVAEGTALTAAKLRGCLYGSAVGDALALPYTGLSAVFTGSMGRETVQGFKPHRSGNYLSGQPSFRVQLMLAVSEALGHEESGLTAEALGSYLYPPARDRVLVEPSDGLLPCLEAWVRGRRCPAVPGVEPPVHLLPLALVEQDDDQVVKNLVAAAPCTGHDSPDALGLGAAFLFSTRYTFAAEEIVLGDLLDAARAAAARFSDTVAEDLNSITDLLCLSERDGMGPLAGEVSSRAAYQVIAGLISFLKSPYDCERGYMIAQRSGAGCVAAFICGALSGAFNGEDKVPRQLRQGLVLRQELERCARALIGRWGHAPR